MGGNERIIETLRVEGRDGEWIETFLGRSETIREFVRCDVPLPPDVFTGNARFRRGMQRSLDERCQLLDGTYPGAIPLESLPPSR